MFVVTTVEKGKLYAVEARKMEINKSQGLLLLARMYLQQSQHDEAANYFKKYVEEHNELDNREELLEALLGIGFAKYQLSQYEESAKYFSQYVEVDSREGLFEALLGQGVANYRLSKYEEAAKYYSMYIEKHKDDDRRDGLLEALLGLGRANRALSKYDESAKYLSQYVALHTEADRRENLLQALVELGIAKYHLSQYMESAKYNSMYIERHTNVDRREDLLQAFVGLGLAKHELSRYEEAAKHNLMYVERHTDVDTGEYSFAALPSLGEKQKFLVSFQVPAEYFPQDVELPTEDGSTEDLLSIFLALGLKNERLSKYEEAAKYYLMYIERHTEVGRREDLLKAFLGLGAAKHKLSQYEESAKHLSQFLKLHTDVDSREDLLQALLMLGSAKYQLSQYEDSAKYNSMYIERHTDIDRRERLLEALLGLGLANHRLSQYEKSAKYFSRYVEVHTQFDNREDLLQTLLMLGSAKYQLSQYEEAAKYCSMYIVMYTGVDRREGLLEALQRIGSAKYKLSQCKEAAKYCSLYIEWQTDDDRREGLLQALLRLGQAKYQLSQYEEATKYLSMYIERHTEKLSESYDEHDDHRVAALKEIIVACKLLIQLLIAAERTDEAIVFADRGRMLILQHIVKKKDSIAVADKSENEKLDLGGIREIAGKENCCIVFYLMMEECLMIWIISEKGVECEKVTKFECEESELLFEGESDPAYYLGKVVYHLNDEVRQASVSRGAASTDPEDVETAECGDEDLMIPESTLSEYRGETGDDSLMSCNQFELLYDWLIAPIQDKLTENKILIIPDNFMFQIPFIALKDKKTGKHLADMKCVRLAPSLMTLQILNDPSSNRGHSKEGALVVAADDVGKVKYKGKETTFKKLEYAAQEAKMIGKLLNVDPLIGKEATKRAVVEQLSGDYTVLHIAAHGTFPGKIILTPNDSSTGDLPRQDDYILHMSDVMEIGVRAQLVVLSCCSRGDGRQTAEGIIGFGRAFLAAGARAVLVALWNVKDRATFLLMEKFYQCFVDGKSASDSLSEAVRALKNIEEYKYETSWGPYALLGGEVYWNEREPGLLHFSFLESPLNVMKRFLSV